MLTVLGVTRVRGGKWYHMPRMSGEVMLNLTRGAMLMAVKGMPLMVSWEQKP